MNVVFACEDVDREHFGVSTVLLKASSGTFKKSKRRATPIRVDWTIGFKRDSEFLGEFTL